MRVKEEKVLHGLSHEIIRETEFNLVVADKTQWRGILNYSNTSGLRRRFGGGTSFTWGSRRDKHSRCVFRFMERTHTLKWSK